MPSQSRGPSQTQGVAPQQEAAPKQATPDLSAGVGNSEVAASIGKAGGEEPSALLAPEPQLKPGAEPAPAPEAKAPEAKAPEAKAPAAKGAQLKPGAKAPEEEKAAGTSKGDVDAGKQGDKAAGKGAKDLKADKGEKVAAKAKDAGPVDKGGGDGKPGKGGGGGDAPPADAKGGGAPAKGDKGGNAAAAFNAASGSGGGGGGGGRKSEGPAASPGPSPAPVANKPTGGAPTGGGGGGGGGGRAPGGSAVGAVAQEAAPIAEIPVADNVKDTMSNFANASPSQQANAWPTLGAALDAKSEAETTKLDESVPEFHAVMGGDANAGGGTTDVATPGMVSNLAGEAGGPVPEPVLAPTVDPGQARYNQGVTNGLDRLGAEAAEDQKARAISAGIGAIQTSDGAVAVSPGVAPIVPLEGDSDPARIGIQTGSMNDEAAAALSKAHEAVVASPGSELVQPLELDEAFEVPALAMEGIADAPEAADMQKYVEQALPADIQASFDEINAPEFEASLADAEGQVGSAVDSRDSEAQTALDKASAENAKMASDAQAQQEASVAAQRGAITSKRDETMAAQASAVASARGQANDASMAEQRRIDTRIAQDNTKISNEYGRAEQQAQDKVAQGERDAADKKRKAEEDAKNKSWWEKACDWVADALSALADVINSIFDAIRSAVTAILDAVKSLANSIIDAAVSFIQDAIAALGSLLKGLIQGLLGDIFPGLADALCSFVDSAVKFAQEQVAVIGDKLKKAVAAACDVVAGVLNKILDVFQSAVNMAIAIASAAITGDWNGVLMKMIEAALRICGIDPEEFYAYVGKAEDTIQIILDDPGHFIGNIIEAVGMGFGQFGDNFLDHLQNGFVGWLTGQSGEAGITMPDDPMSMGGVLDIALQVLGITPEGLEEIATERIGEENVEKIKFVWGFVESAISGGLEGLWDHLSEFLDGIYDEVIGAIQEWLMEKVVMAAISKIATMWNPIGAIVQALITAWNVYQWLQAQAARIMGIVKSVVDSMHDIATGNLGGAANMVEGALAGLVPVAIDLLASLLGISGIGKKVQEIVGGIRSWVRDAINKMIDKFLGLFTGGGKDEAKPEEAKPDDAKPVDKKPEGEADGGSLTLQGNWGTSSPILYHYKAQDREDLAELRAHGSYQLDVADQAAMDRQWKRGEGESAKYDNKGMHDWTRSLLLKHFTNNVANAHMAVEDVTLATSYKGFAAATKMGLDGELASYGMRAKSLDIALIDTKGSESGPANGAPDGNAQGDNGQSWDQFKKTFTADGETHTLFLKPTGIEVHSTPMTGMALVGEWKHRNTTETDAAKKASVDTVVNDATGLFGQLDPKRARKKTLDDAVKANSALAPTHKDEIKQLGNDMTSLETQIVPVLSKGFELLGDAGARTFDTEVELPGNDVAKYKWQQIQAGHGTANVDQFKKGTNARLSIDPQKKLLNAMKEEVWSKESDYLRRGDPIPWAEVIGTGGLGRCMNILAVWGYNMKGAAKASIEAEIDANGSAAGKSKKDQAFAWLANNQNKFNPDTDMSGQTRGAVGASWWYALKDGGATDLAKLREELTLNDASFEAGAVRLTFPGDSLKGVDPHFTKPTGFDGLFQGGDQDPMWGANDGGDTWGLTKSDKPVREGVTGPIDIDKAAKREFIKGSVDAAYAPGSTATPAPAAAPGDRGTDYLNFLNGPDNKANSGAKYTQEIIDTYLREAAPPAGEQKAKARFEAIITAAGWTSNKGELDVQWARFKTHNKHIKWGAADVGKPFEEQAAEFEQRLGTKAFSDPRANTAAANMCRKALATMNARADLGKKYKEADETMGKLLMLCGTKVNDVWAGRVGAGTRSIPKITAVMEGKGNLREMCNHIGGFMENVLGPDLMTQTDAYLTELITQANLNLPALMQAKADAEARHTANPSAVPGSKPKGELINNGTPILGPQSDTQSGSTVTAANAQLAKKSKSRDEVNKPKTTTGAANPAVQSTTKKSDATTPLSENEKELGGDLLPWIEGKKVWSTDNENAWNKEAKRLNMPLAGGISGTTQRLMQSNVLLGSPAADSSVRLAAIGYLIPINAHTFHEIMQAASSWCAYTPGEYAHVAPLSDAEVSALGPPTR